MTMQLQWSLAIRIFYLRKMWNYVDNCRYLITGENACNPTHADLIDLSEFPCEEGYEGRLCSQCERNYFLIGRRCIKCASSATLISIAYLIQLIIISNLFNIPRYITIAFLLIAYGWFISPTGSALPRILIFHLQSIYFLVVGGLKWNATVSSVMQTVSTAATFSVVAMECLISG